MLKIGEQAPDLSFKTLEHGQWKLSESNPQNFTLIVAYRGLHCPLCKKQLEAINKRIKEFEKLGVKVVAVSQDNESKAKETREKWDIENIVLGYDLDLIQATNWNLYISKAANEKEPSYFTEPGSFLVKSDGKLYSSIISNSPFARPDLDQYLSGIEYILEHDYPFRGTVRDISLATK